MRFIDDNSEDQAETVAPRGHELAIEILKCLTPGLALVVLLLGLNASMRGSQHLGFATDSFCLQP